MANPFLACPLDSESHPLLRFAPGRSSPAARPADRAGWPDVAAIGTDGAAAPSGSVLRDLRHRLRNLRPLGHRLGRRARAVRFGRGHQLGPAPAAAARRAPLAVPTFCSHRSAADDPRLREAVVELRRGVAGPGARRASK